MYLTTIDHEGREWTVHVTVLPAAAQPAPLAFTFCHTSPDPEGEDAICTWEASREALYALYEQGNEFSEAVLLEQLAHALARERTAEPAGVGTPGPDPRERGFQ